MRRHIISIVAACLLTASCSNGSDDAPKAKSTAEPAPASPAPAVKLSEEWVPKLEAATGKGRPNICLEAGSDSCVEHITMLTSLVYDVETAIEEADARLRYPRSSKTIEKVTQSSEAYVAAECEGGTDLTLDGGVCGESAAQMLVGPATLMMQLETDELTAS